jgi:multisubunit Na+/H+ antiporter MnhG subunit
VVFYAASMTVSSFALTASWVYAVHRRLINPSVPAAEVRAFTGRAVATSAVFLLSVGAAFLGLPVAVLFWLVLLPLARLLLARASARRGPQALQT